MMNLINDCWIPVVREDGSMDKIACWQIGDFENPVVDITAPRPDLQGALYQFLIGLLQTTFAPKSRRQWFAYYEKQPEVSELKKAFASVSAAFDLDISAGPAFMQEQEDFTGDELPIEDLVGGELSDNTRKLNKDLFLKRGVIQTISPYWAGLSLFNVQTSGVLAWGKHRIGLRLNGPVTTLVTTKRQSTLWVKLWLNVIERDKGVLLPGDWEKKGIEHIFPWMGKIRISPKKEKTTPADGSPLQHFWPLPRRIRLKCEPVSCRCDITGDPITIGVRTFKRITNGVFYSDGWVHPLSSYVTDKKKKSFPKAFAGKDMSYGFGDWAALICGTDTKQSKVAIATAAKQSLYQRNIEDLNLRCFGYRADSAKVIGYFDKTLPAYHISEEDSVTLSNWLFYLIDIIENMASSTVELISEAWWGVEKSEKERNKHAIKAFKSSNAVNQLLYSSMENHFYGSALPYLVEFSPSAEFPPTVAKQWLKFVLRACYDLFDEIVMENDNDAKMLRQIVLARNKIDKDFYKLPSVKKMNQFAKGEE